MSFKYSDEATEAIAHQLPLQKEAFGDKETRSFFINLLPEGDVAKKIAQIKQVSLNNPFALLRELGGECAGAVICLVGTYLPLSDKINIIPVSYL